MINDHIEASLDKIRLLFKEAAGRIEALNPDGSEKVPATLLAQEIAEKHGMTGPALYPTLKFLFTDYPNVEVLRGAHGGIRKIAPNKIKATVVTPAAVPAVTATVTDSTDNTAQVVDAPVADKS